MDNIQSYQQSHTPNTLLQFGSGSKDKKESSIDNTIEQDVLLKEDMITQYLALLSPEDRFFLNLPYIHKEGEKYIANIREKVYPEYKEQLRNLVSRYSNRRKYQIRATKNAVIAISTDNNIKAKQTKSSSDTSTNTSNDTNNAKPLASIDKPVFMLLDDVLKKGRSAVQSRRSAIKMQYEHLLSKPYLDEKDKAKFMKQRELFIETLNAFYTVQYYSNKINSQITNDKNVSIPIVVDYQQQEVKNPVPRIDSVDINVNHNLIEQMYEQEGTKLDMYNSILELQANNASKKEINNAVKEYIQYDSHNETMKSINNKIKKLKNRKPVNLLIVETRQDRPIFCKKHIPKSSSSKNNSSSS